MPTRQAALILELESFSSFWLLLECDGALFLAHVSDSLLELSQPTGVYFLPYPLHSLWHSALCRLSFLLFLLLSSHADLKTPPAGEEWLLHISGVNIDLS